ncbi:MAG: hypothetical protein QM808_06735 [Steroidobacteraceae bacterium]
MRCVNILTRAIKLLGLCSAALLSGSAYAQSVTPEKTSADYLLMVFMKPLPERQAEYFKWYQGQHMGEVLERPGFVTARIYKAVNADFLPGNDHPNPVLIKYGIRTDNITETFSIDSQLSQAARLADPPLDAKATQSFTYEKTGEEINGKGARSVGTGALKTYEFFVLSSAKATRDAEVNAWYGAQIKELSTIPGVVSAQRYQRSAVQRYSGAQSPTYMVVYGIVTNDLQTVFRDLSKSLQKIGVSDAVDDSANKVFVYEALGPLMERK